jgi:glycosyltransferase involved in cell wall biosynthesis
MSLNILQMISKNDRYGAQRVFLDQVACMNRLGNRVIVAVPGLDGYVTESVRSMGIPCYSIPMKGVADLLHLRRLVKQHDIDIIHTSLDRADYLGVMLSMLVRRPVVSTMHVPRYHPGLSCADAVIVSSRQQAKTLQDKGVKPEKIHLVRPGIDTERFISIDSVKRDAWQQALGTAQYTMVLCHISSLIPRKAHEVSLEIIAACKQQGEKPLLVIIGDPLCGAYYDSLLVKIKELGLQENVHFTGWTADVAEILSLSHVTVLPSTNEALGIVLMEGMAAGTPIVAREGEGGAELIDEYGTGYLYDPAKGVQPLAEELVSLCRNAARHKVLADRCRTIAVDEFSLANYGRRLMLVNEAVLRH